MGWTDKLKGYCRCLNDFPQKIDTFYCNEKCPALPLRRQLESPVEPQKELFTKNLILVGAFSRKEIVGILERVFNMQYGTANRKVDICRRALIKAKYHVYKTDDGRLIATKI